jgi:hypothetical protein
MVSVSGARSSKGSAALSSLFLSLCRHIALRCIVHGHGHGSLKDRAVGSNPKSWFSDHAIRHMQTEVGLFLFLFSGSGSGRVLFSPVCSVVL